jgi:hypothetical protein
VRATAASRPCRSENAAGRDGYGSGRRRLTSRGMTRS